MKGEDQTMLLGEQWKAVECEPNKSLPLVMLKVVQIMKTSTRNLLTG